MTEESSSLSRSTAVISLATTVSRLAGLVLIIVIAAVLGYTNFADSYNLGNVMPNMLFELIIGGVLTSLFIPIFVEHWAKSEDEAWRVACNILNVSTIALIFVALLGTIFADHVVRLQTFMVPAGTEKAENAAFFFRFFVWEIVFYGFCAILNGVLQTRRKFLVPAAAPIVNNVVTIITILAVYLPLRETNPRLAMIGLAVGTTLGVAAMAAVQVPALIRAGFKFTPVVSFRDPAVRKMALLSLPVLGYVASNQVGAGVANALAYQFEGGMTAFTFAWRFFQLPYGVLAVSIATVLFPTIAGHAAAQDMAKFKRTLSLGIRTTGFVMIPVSIFIFLMSRPMIALPLQHWNFSAKGVSQTAEILSYFALGLFPFSIFVFITKVFYSLKDAVTPMKINALGVPLNIILDVALVRALGVPGLAIAHTVTYLFTMLLLLASLRRAIGPLGGRQLAGSSAKFAFVSLFMGAIIAWTGYMIGGLGLGRMTTDALTLVAAGLAGTIAYFGVNYVLRTGEMEFVRGLLPSAFGGGRIVRPKMLDDQQEA